MAKKIGIVIGWRKLQWTSKVVRVKQREEKINGESNCPIEMF